MPDSLPPFDPHAFLKTLTSLPGVYRMLDTRGQVLYVGKARNLKKRVASYFRANPSSAKVRSLVSHIQAIEITVTNTEGEALILESNLIKQFKPRYNVLLRDDKGYPYLHLSDDPFPRLRLHRGARRAAGRYFGPYPNAGTLRDTLNLLQKIFKLRTCEDSVFQNRSRPCLQYQIKRCTAPCTGLIDETGYRRDVQHAVLFLDGKSGQVIDDLVRRMEAAADRLAFEEAAIYRDQIVQLRQVQERQYVSGDGGDYDVVACTVQGEAACVEVLFFRAGRLLGNKAFFPRIPAEESASQVLSAFLAQYYLQQMPPPEILLDQDLDATEVELLASVLHQRTGRRITISTPLRGDQVRWLDLARRNAKQALAAQLASQAGLRHRFTALQQALALEQPPARLECFDISHTQGEATVAACVVFTVAGPLKTAYRRYNIAGIIPGDDYAALHQALTRRFTRLRTEGGDRPDIVFIDGGKGQLAQAEAVLAELELRDITLIGIAKGADRKPGLELLYRAGSDRPLLLGAQSAALHLIQQIRDEAHRFAITGHRQRRAKARTTSVLEDIPGIGRQRRQQLLKQFGGLRQLARAGVDDLAQVAGISRELAQRIYDRFHGDS